jgi:hypothetical protein
MLATVEFIISCLPVSSLTTSRFFDFIYYIYGFEASSLALREEQRLRMLGNRVLRRTFGTNRERVAGV